MRCLGLDQSVNQRPSLRLLKHSLLKFQPDCTFMEISCHQWLHSLLSPGLLVSLQISDSALHYNSLGKKAAEMSRRCKFSQKEKVQIFPFFVQGIDKKKKEKSMDIPHQRVKADTRAEDLRISLTVHHYNSYTTVYGYSIFSYNIKPLLNSMLILCIRISRTGNSPTCSETHHPCILQYLPTVQF